MRPFEITEEAKHQIEKLLEKNPSKYAVSLAVLGGGCAGFKYDWGFAEATTLKTGTQVNLLWTRLP